MAHYRMPIQNKTHPFWQENFHGNNFQQEQTLLATKICLLDATQFSAEHGKQIRFLAAKLFKTISKLSFFLFNKRVEMKCSTK